MDTTIVNVRNVSNGKIHRRFSVAGTKELASFEADNADEAGEIQVIHGDELAKARPEDFCKRCFPERT